jgi:hypothetical protein
MTIVSTAPGKQVTGRAKFRVPSSVNTVGAIVTYTLEDAAGLVYASGVASSTSDSSIGRGWKELTALATVSIPGSVPVLTDEDKLQLVWVCQDVDLNYLGSYIETFWVYPSTRMPYGVPDIVEVFLDNAVVMANLPSDDPVDISIFKNNTLLKAVSSLAIDTTRPVYSGHTYTWQIDGATQAGIVESLVPYIVLWNYVDDVTGEHVTEDGYLYHVNPSILMAAKELQSMVNRVRASYRLPELTIDLPVCIHFLKMGVDYLNSIGKLTNYTMTNAQGALRAFWIACAEVLLLQSQYLMEAERSFTMNGQSVTLDYDITAAYQSMAQEKQGYIDTHLPTAKANLSSKGIVDGDGGGDVSGSMKRAGGSIGVTLTPISNFYSVSFPRRRV